jgi:hypothetical protein
MDDMIDIPGVNCGCVGGCCRDYRYNIHDGCYICFLLVKLWITFVETGSSPYLNQMLEDGKAY